MCNCMNGSLTGSSINLPQSPVGSRLNLHQCPDQLCNPPGETPQLHQGISSAKNCKLVTTQYRSAIQRDGMQQNFELI